MKSKALQKREKRTAIVPVRRESDTVDVLSRRVDSFLDEFMGGFENDHRPHLPAIMGRTHMINPKFEMKETAHAVEMTAELPGMKEKEIEVILDEDALTIRGVQNTERTEQKKAYRMTEQRYGTFEHMISLPYGVERDKVSAKFKNGVLHVTLPKSSTTHGARKHIEIKS